MILQQANNSLQRKNLSCTKMAIFAFVTADHSLPRFTDYIAHLRSFGVLFF